MIQFTNQFNQCSKILCALFTTLLLLFLIDYYFKIVFFNGIFLFAYLSCIVTVTILITTVLIQHVLKLNKPIDYNSKKKYLEPFLGIYWYFNKNVNDGSNNERCKDNVNELFDEVKDVNIDVRIQEFIGDIKQRFILNWYREISSNEQFLKETEQLLDEIIRRFLQIVIAVDNRSLIQGILAILLRHIKEFKKALKRSQKNDICIEDAYRYNHIGSTSLEKYEEFICQLTTKLLKQFVSSELWSSLVWRTLVSILSKKLTTTTLIHISKPGFINYFIVSVCAKHATKEQLQLHRMTYISISNVNLKRKTERKSNNVVEKKHLKLSNNVDGGNTPKISPKKITLKSNLAAKIEKKPKPVPEIKEPLISLRVISEPVKIYQSSSEKTWRNSSDLESVSFGEDLLALQETKDPDTQIQSLIEKKLWNDNSDSLEVEEKPHNIFESIFKDDEDVSPSNLQQAATQIITSTMKPIGNVTANTIQNMKDLQQSTVNTVNSVVKPISQVTNSAKHKIGDLQDEAAGVMEGIFDFGMAGLRKGLRLTGLHDNIGEIGGKKLEKFDDLRKRNDGKHSKKLTKSSQAICEDDRFEKSSSNDSDDNVWVNPLTKFSPNFDGHILLEKSPIKEIEPKVQNIPKISTDLDTTSPDLEYEDTVDLATTTAKLRSLLAQRTSESPTPAVSPMPQDDKVTPSIERLVAAELSDVDGVMPSLYKFYNKTATGLQQTFNTLKTALPGNEKLDEKTTTLVDGINWQFVPDNKKNSLFKRMETLLSERRDYCVIDPAYDYVEILDETDKTFNKNDPQFDDDLDEFDIQVPMAKTLLEIVCELLADTNTYFTQEPIMKCCLVLFGKLIEDKLDEDSQCFLRHIKNYIRKLPTNATEYPLAMKVEKMIDCCLEQMPGYLTTAIGRASVEEGLKTLITSFQCININRDVFLQIFELCTIHLVKVNNLMSPTYSA